MGNRNTAKRYGADTQSWVAAWYRRLWPGATTQGASVSGRDVLNVPLSIEVKGRADFEPLAWARQAKRSARPEEDVLPPQVVMRPRGIGPESIGQFLVFRTLADDTAILAEVLAWREDAGQRGVILAPDSVVQARKLSMGEARGGQAAGQEDQEEA